MRLKLIASLLALCLIFSIGSALANTGTKDCEKTSGAMSDKMNGMSGMGCEKMTGAMTEGKMAGAMKEKMGCEKMTGAMAEGKMAGAMKEKMGCEKMTGAMTEGKMAGATKEKMSGMAGMGCGKMAG